MLEQMPGNDSEGHTLGVIAKASGCLERHQGQVLCYDHLPPGVSRLSSKVIHY